MTTGAYISATATGVYIAIAILCAFAIEKEDDEVNMRWLALVWPVTFLVWGAWKVGEWLWDKIAGERR